MPIFEGNKAIEVLNPTNFARVRLLNEGYKLITITVFLGRIFSIEERARKVFEV